MATWASYLRGGLMASVAAGAVAVADAAWAQTKTFDLPAQPAATGVAAFARQADVQVLISAVDAQGRRTNAVRGAFPVLQGLEILLAGTGLTAQATGPQTWTVVPVPPSEAAAPAAAAEPAVLGELIVTAQKREERLRDVPFAISAITNEALARSGAQGAEDYLAQAPGVSYNALGRGRSTIVMRGVATEVLPSNLQPTVEVYLDELPLTDRFGAWTQPDIDTFDLERVEILRGPQGTLFGSGALGGAVRLVTNKPDLSQFGARLMVDLSTTRGGEDSTSVNGMLNVPLVNDELGLRLVAFRRRDGGYIDDIRNGDINYNGGSENGGRVLLAYEPNDALSVRLTAAYNKEVLKGAPISFRSAADGGPYEWDPTQAERSSATLRMANLAADYDLGFATLSSATTYGDRDSFLYTDYAGALDVIFGGIGLDPSNETSLERDSKRFAQEVRLISSSESRLQWTVGGFLLKFRGDTYQYWNVGSPTPTLLLEDWTVVKTREAAVFGEVTYKFSEAIRVTAGARYFDNVFSIDTLSNPVAAIQNTSPYTKSRDSALTPKVSLSFYPSEKVHLYATASKGYRIGQVNFNAGINPLIPKAYGPDSLWNYEVGIKADLFNNRLQLNGAGFLIEWSDIQTVQFLLDSSGNEIPATNHTANAGKARVRGVEAELVLRPVAGIELGHQLTYTDAELKSVLPGVALTPGVDLPGTPKWSISNFVQLDWPVRDGAEAFARLTHRYVGAFYSGIFNTPLDRSEAYHKLDARVGVRFGQVEFAAYVENLTDSDAIALGGGEGISTLGFATSVTRLRPRTIGLTMSADF